MAKTVTNILKLSPTHFVSNIRHQHRCSRFGRWIPDFNFNEIKINGSPVLQSQIKSYPDAVRTCQGQNSSLTVPKDTNAFFDFAISEPKNQFWSPIKRLNMTYYQALFQLLKHLLTNCVLYTALKQYTACTLKLRLVKLLFVICGRKK